MKKHFVIVLTSSLLLSACAEPLQTPEKTYRPYGLFNKSTARSRDVCYEISAGNVFWAIFLVETIIVPIVIVGFYLWEPVREKWGKGDDCEAMD